MIGTKRLAALAVSRGVRAGGVQRERSVHRPKPCAICRATGVHCASERAPSVAAEKIKLGFITKFPVDFFDVMVESVKVWAKDHPEVEVLYGQGKSGTDDEGRSPPSNR